VNNMGRKPKGYWQNSNNYIREMEKAIEMNNGERPTANWLRENGFHQIVRNAKLHGGICSVLDSLLEKSSRRPRGYFKDIDNFYAEVDRAIRENGGKHPTDRWLRENGYNSLPVVSRSFGLSFADLLNERTEKIQHGINYWKDTNNYFRELSKAIEENGGKRPSSNWLADNGYRGIIKNAKLHGENLPSILDEICIGSNGKKPQGYWKNPDNFYTELEDAIGKNDGLRPGQLWLDQNGYRGITANAKYHGGSLTNVLNEYFGNENLPDKLKSMLEDYVSGGEMDG